MHYIRIAVYLIHYLLISTVLSPAAARHNTQRSEHVVKVQLYTQGSADKAQLSSFYQIINLVSRPNYV